MKLTAEQKFEALRRSVQGLETQAEIARSLGCTPARISQIARAAGAPKRRNGARPRLSAAEFAAIYEAAWRGEPQKTIAARFGVTVNYVSLIKSGRVRRAEGGRWAS